jgi:hypothetical protein
MTDLNLRQGEVSATLSHFWCIYVPSSNTVLMGANKFGKTQLGQQKTQIFMLNTDPLKTFQNSSSKKYTLKL